MRLTSAIVRAALVAFVLACTASIAAQDWLGLAPLGVVNRGPDEYRAVSLAFALAGLVLAALLASELLFGRARRTARLVRRALVAAIALEVILWGVDTALVSRAPTSSLGGPYWETRTASGDWIPLHRAHPGSALGFRWTGELAREPRGTRLLFLGDSYTEGSGRSAKCNYPDVVQTALARATGAEVEVMNAGVGGYGPREDAKLLRFLREQGFVFHAVVVNLFLENDISDDLPDTERRVYWGMIERLPTSRWLAALHPLNTRAFRLAGTLARLLQADQSERLATWRSNQPCRPATADATPLPLAAPLEKMLVRRLDGSAAIQDERRALDELVAGLADIRAQTRELGVPLLVVVFPDRVLGDPEVREALVGEGIDVTAPFAVRARVLSALADYAPIDATEALASQRHAYRPVDTHLSDHGNVVAGALVATRIAERAASLGLSFPPAPR